MKKFLFAAFSVFTLSILPTFADAQTKISLLPTTMRKYIGKIKKADWEKIVGSPNISDFPHAIYEVANTHTRQYTDISCKYRKADSVLIEVHYPSKEFLGYWEAVEKMPGYSKEKNVKYWEAPNQSAFVLTLTYDNFCCEITYQMFLNYDIKYTATK